MSKQIRAFTRFVGGISDFRREGIADSYAFGQSVDYRTDPQNLSILPRTIKESGSVVTDLPYWAEQVSSGITYLYGSTGNIYARTSAGSYSNIHMVPNSHGNGLSWFAEDDYLYYTGDGTIGRYGPLSNSPQFYDDFLTSQGGVVRNTYSLKMVAASSQYAFRADTASLSLSSALTLESWIDPDSLPTTGNSMTIISKWNENGNLRSYKFDILPTSNYFGDGSDGALTISADTTDAPIDSACTGTAGTPTLSATNASFAANQDILVIQSQGTNAGQYERRKIQSYTAGTITLTENLSGTYTTGAQVLVLKKYTNVTVNSGKTWTAKAWNGTVGGILAFVCNGTLTNNGSITAKGKGFSRGGLSVAGQAGNQGEGTGGIGTQSTSSNGNGAGGGAFYALSPANGGGGGGGNQTNGTDGVSGAVSGGTGGLSSGNDGLTSMTFGGQGGAGGSQGTRAGNGGLGGGIIFISAVTISNVGTINADAANHPQGVTASANGGGGGGGGGGSILIKTQTATLGTLLVTAAAGSGGAGFGGGANGSNGSEGRIHIDYYTSYTGTTRPTINASQDNTLSSSDGYALRLSLSSDGTAVENAIKSASLNTSKWQHVAVTWDNTSNLASFYLDKSPIGSVPTTTASINDNASQFFLGTYKNGSGTAVSFFDGNMDSPRVWNLVRSADDISYYADQYINPATGGLVGYWHLNNNYLDETSNANDLTASGTTFEVGNVPFSAPTTRNDIDQTQTLTGQTYTVPTAIAETAANKIPFTPTKDPQKSASVVIASKGTGDWTLTIHDQDNKVVNSATVTNANLATGTFEFVFPNVWRPIYNYQYHIHLTSTVADGTVITGTTGDLSTASYTTYFSYLVTMDTFHPIAKMLQFLVFGNERYVGTYEATVYNPNKLTLSADMKVRCFGYWREYLAIGCYKGNNLTSYDQGRIYFWDGIASTFNFYIDVPEGAVNSLHGSRGQLYISAGYQGDILIYEGGDTARKIKRIPKIEIDKTLNMYPGAVTMWKALMRFGYGYTNSSSVYQGVYTYGSTNYRYEDTLSYDYPISTGDTTNTDVQIGLTYPVGGKLLIGWKDGISYGVDYVDSSNDPYPQGFIEFLIDDDSSMWKEKEATELVANFDNLTAGQSFRIGYDINDNGGYQMSAYESTTDATVLRQSISDGRYNQYQVKVEMNTTTSDSPTLYAVSISKDMLETESRIG